MKTLLALLGLSAVTLHAATQITWTRQQLHGDFYSEGAGIGDINGDSKPDIVAGPFWWEGPAFQKKHAYYEPKIFNINGYSDNFFAYVHDFNADQKNDILILGFPGKEARLYLNPGTHDDTPWPTHIVADIVDNESPVFTDITGDGNPEIVCSTAGKFGWFSPDWKNPTAKWSFTPATPDQKVAKFTHGLGVGDVNNDGHLDLLEARHWWQSPSSISKLPSSAAPQLFTQHTFATGIPGGAQMFAYDFDGNGTNDIFTTLAAHRYGVAVFLQNKVGPASSLPAWTRIMLASEKPQDNHYAIVFSQPHAAHLADIDGDGIKDIVTGKRYWAHNGKDPGEQSSDRVIYWYQTKRDGQGGVDFIPHLIDANTGVGTDVQVGDLNNDTLPDILVANKAGVFILTQHRSETSADLTPRKLYGPGLKPQKDYAHGLSPQDALKNIQLPTGFKAELIAAEPDLVQPIAFTFDERGRIWVVEGNSYPKPREPGQGQDRIKILEDTDGDGTYETKKIFCEGLNLASGIELGFGGVYVGAAPYLIFIPRDGDTTLPLNSNRAIPGPSDSTIPKNTPSPQVPGLPFTAHILLDGWGSQDTHETLNSFLWGPDGWLYGCHGVFTHSLVGKPGTPDAQLQPLNAGIWRYHPIRHEFEVFAHGTSNPWGLDYDQHGEFFVTSCVIPHLYHIVPGGRYQRQAGQHFNPHTYEDIQTIADHLHYAGNIRDNAHWGTRQAGALVADDTNALGGGHAHCGLAIYQSNLFPPTYRNQLLFGNLHGHRLVANVTDPKGSTYTGKHAADFLRSNDMHFIPVTQKVGPDGALYVSDWSDQQICHRGSNAVENWDRTNGRLYRITYPSRLARQSKNQQPTGKAALPFPKAPFDLSKESDQTLAQLAIQTENEWFSRTARRVLWDTSMSQSQTQGVLRNDSIRTVLPNHVEENPARKLKRTWMAISLGGMAENAQKLINDDERVSVAVLRSLSGRHFQFGAIEQLVKDVATSSSQIIRRETASLLQRMPDGIKGENGQAIRAKEALATALLNHPEDKDDPIIPLLIWYGIEPLVGADPQAGLLLAKASKIPKVTEFIYRRLTASADGWDAIFHLADQTEDLPTKIKFVEALVAARKRGTPRNERFENWTGSIALLRDGETPQLKQLIYELSVLEGESGENWGVQLAQSTLANPEASIADRESALDLLLQIKEAKTAQTLLQIVSKEPPSSLRRKAIQALASLKNADTPKTLGAALPTLPTDELPDAINTLATTPEGAKTLLQAVAAKTLPPTALSPFLIRQLTTFNDPELNTLIKTVWGDLNAPKPDLAERTQKYRNLLTPAALEKADLAQGKMIFTATCGACHKLFGEGQNVGPDITGSNRADLNYLLENVLDPNAVIGKDYQLNLFTMQDGRVLGGVIKGETPDAIKIAMMGGVEFTLPQADIAKREVSKQSTMPEGLFDALPQDMLLNLVKYLQSTGTAPTAPRTGIIEAETLTTTTTGGKTKPQAMGNFRSGTWSSNSHLWWTGAKPGQKLTLTFNAPKSGPQKLHAVFTKAPDYGIVTVRLNGAPTSLQNLDLYDPKVIPTPEQLLGTFDLKAGPNTLEIEITGTNPAARPSHMAALDYLRLD